MLHTCFSSMTALCPLPSCCEPSKIGEPMPTIHIMSYQDPRAFLDAVGPWLRAERLASNTILTYAEMALSSQDEPQLQQQISYPELLWVVCWSLFTPDPSPIGAHMSQVPSGVVIPSTSAPQLRLIVQVGGFVKGATGALPLCIFAPNMLNTLTTNGSTLVDVMPATAARLAQLRSPSLISSLFGPAPLVHSFSLAWDEFGAGTTRSSIQRRLIPLRFPHTSVNDPRNFECVAPIGVLSVRRATDHDMHALKSLYHEADLAAFAWHQTKAQDHLGSLLKASNVWLFEIQEGSDADGVVAFCECGGRAKNLAVITALYTIPAFRRRGFGSYMLSGVVQSLLATGITFVVAYAPVETLPSECVFRKVGFTAVEDSEWLEVGYGV